MDQLADYEELTQEEKLKIEKTRKKIRENVYKYFRQFSLSKIKVSFSKWKERVQLERAIERKYASSRKRLNTRHQYHKLLMMEQSKQNSKLLINNFPSLKVMGSGQARPGADVDSQPQDHVPKDKQDKVDPQKWQLA